MRPATFSFQIKEADVESVKKTCVELDCPLLEEYDYRYAPYDLVVVNVLVQT